MHIIMLALHGKSQGHACLNVVSSLLMRRKSKLCHRTNNSERSKHPKTTFILPYMHVAPSWEWRVREDNK